MIELYKYKTEYVIAFRLNSTKHYHNYIGIEKQTY